MLRLMVRVCRWFHLNFYRKIATQCQSTHLNSFLVISFVLLGLLRCIWIISLFFQQAHNRPKMICNLPFGEFRFKDGSNKNEKEEEMQICLPHLDRNHSSFSTESEKCKCQTERMITIETSDPQSPRMAMKLGISFNHFAVNSWKTRELLCVYDKIIVESAFLMHTNACG